MSTSTQAPVAQPHSPTSATVEPIDGQHRCESCGSWGLRTVALLCSKPECRDVILDDATAPEADLEAEAARKHTCPYCGTFGDPIEMIECPGGSNPVRKGGETEDYKIASGTAVGAIAAGNDERQDVAVTSDEQVTAGEQAAATQASDDAQRLLKLAPDVFRWAAATSGVTAIVAGEIDRKRLYTTEGFRTFEQYAEKKLGVSSTSASKKLRQAGKAVWEFYPDLAAEVLRIVREKGHARVGDLPEVPDETKLYLLKRAHENADEHLRARLLEGVRGRTADGTVPRWRPSTREFEKMARHPAVQPSHEAPKPRDRGAAGTPAPKRAQPAPDAVLAPPAQTREPAARSAAPLSVAPTVLGSAEALEPQTEDRFDAEGSVNVEALLSRAFRGLDEARDALSRLAPGEIKADRLSSLRELSFKVHHALEAHKEEYHE